MALILFCFSIFFIPIAWSPFSFPFLPTINDLWTAKDFLVLMFSLGIICLSRSGGKMGKNANPWISILLLYIPISIYSSPPLELKYFWQNMGGLWGWRSFAWCLLYFALSCALGGLSWARERTKRCVALSFVWGALISSVYAILQAGHLDQWQIGRTYAQIGHPAAMDIVSNIGNPSYLAVYLGICLPFALLYLPWAAIPIVAVICVAQSDFAFVGTILTGLLMLCLRSGKMIVLKICAGLVVFGCFLAMEQWPQIRTYLEHAGNGRMECWQNTLHDWKSPCIIMKITDDMPEEKRRDLEMFNKRTYVFTGRGPGSFPFIYQPKYKVIITDPNLAYQVPFDSPHNVYLRVLYEMGLTGLIIFVGALIWIFNRAIKSFPFDRFKLAVFCSAFFICFIMIGTPVEQINPLAYFSVVIMSILSVI